MKKRIAIWVLACVAVCAAACARRPEPSGTPEPTVSAQSTEEPDTPQVTLEYRLDSQKENPAGDSYAEPTEEFVQKVNAIFMEYTHPQNEAFENVLGLYQYVSQNIAYSEEGAADAADAIMTGSANRRGFAGAYQYLLNQIGVESYIAATADGTTTWVMASLPDGFYHFDAAAEAQKTQGQSLEFFAMNDERRRDNGAIPDWSLLDGEERREAPTNEKQTYWYTRNVRAGYGVDYENNCLYFADVSQDNELVKYDYVMNVEEALFGKRAGSMVYARGNLYFSDLDQRNQLFRLEVATGRTELLDSVFVTRMLIKDGQLIYFDDISSSEKGILLD